MAAARATSSVSSTGRLAWRNQAHADTALRHTASGSVEPLLTGGVPRARYRPSATLYRQEASSSAGTGTGREFQIISTLSTGQRMQDYQYQTNRRVAALWCRYSRQSPYNGYQPHSVRQICLSNGDQRDHQVGQRTITEVKQGAVRRSPRLLRRAAWHEA